MTGVQLVNVHALGGTAMLEAAVQAISAGVPMGADRPRLLAVTILTSMDQKTMKEVGIGGSPKLRVVKLAQLAKKTGVDGVVASVQEAKAIRKTCGREFLIVTPGVRPERFRSGIQIRRSGPQSYAYRSDPRRSGFSGGWQANPRRTRSARRRTGYRRRNRRREVTQGCKATIRFSQALRKRFKYDADRITDISAFVHGLRFPWTFLFGAMGLAIGCHTAAAGLAVMMVGSWVSLIRESKHSLRSPPPCQAGNVQHASMCSCRLPRSRRFSVVAVATCILVKATRFPRSCQILPYVHTWSGTRQTLGSLYRAFDTNASRANLTSLPSHFDWA